MKNILEQFEITEEKFPDKILFSDVENSISMSFFKSKCKKIATKIAKLNLHNQPILVVDNRDVDTIVEMISVVYSGNYYIVLDKSSPIERLNKICQVAQSKLILCNDATIKLCEELKTTHNFNVLNIKSCENEKIDEEKLDEIRKKSISTDPVYVLFTSGSTGTPKGTVINHNNLISYINWFASTFEIDEKTSFASQTPFYFSASVSDLYSSLFFGATFNIIPKSYFTFPIQLVRFLNERKVNTIYWVPSALCIVANVKLFDYEKPLFLEKVMFAGEVMPNKQLNYWRNALPNVQYANLFGPTETTDICTYYIVNREFKDEDSLPIGKSCENLDTFVIDENGKQVTEPFKQGELYVRGSFVSSGYYKNEEQTKKSFVQNPLNNLYPEIVYKTGDIVYINSFGEYEYVGRTDFQIKHKGYRIELGEIERNLYAVKQITTAVALYDKEEDKLIVVYIGKIKKEELYDKLRELIPEYMLPEVLVKVSTLPYNQNGKIDRKNLLLNYKNLI